MKAKMLSFLLVLCVFLGGCADEPLKVDFWRVGAAPPEGELGPPPPHIAKLLYGEDDALYNHTLRILLEYEQWKERGEGDTFKPVVAVHFEDTIRRKMMMKLYYTKYLDADGIAILGSGYIRDQYFFAARELVLEMTSKRPELRDILAFTGEPKTNPTGHPAPPSPRFRMILYNPDQGISAIPEEFPYPPFAVGWCSSAYCVATADENIVLTEESPNIGEVRIHMAFVFIHEFAHAIHYAIQTIDATFNARLREAYEEAVENDSVFGHGINEHWAQTAVNWFLQFSLPNGKGDWQYEKFKECNPRMHALMEEWYDFKYLGYVDAKRE